ncbi:hypothetical protein [Verrucomicrobium sp. BvORR034]|uniref:hypothetical protein n=1 Tax=Verrucomicrobium sp. BvORR034 TaxID=1396418 RepID=UPI000678FF8A|nr:hypothetical protein [Verrucomicrobium sp. BvORR034]
MKFTISLSTTRWAKSVFSFGLLVLCSTAAMAADSDGDGMDDTVDPDPYSHDNFSTYNGILWGPGDGAIGDNDNDSILNYYDSTPYPDSDGDGLYDYSDGILFITDPAPNDSTNYSSTNGIAWYGDLFGDADGDLSLNFYDALPYDADNDGFDDSSDPFPNDYTNYSSINNTGWYSDVLGNADLDSLLNWEDPNPYDYDY